MAQVMKKAVGLDIGTSSVKIVELSKSEDKIVLEKFGVEEIAPQASEGEGAEENNNKALVEAVSKVKEKSGIKETDVIAAVSGQSVIVRYIDLPKMTEEELKSTIRYEAEQYIPFNIDDVMLDYQVLQETSEGEKKMNVLLVAAKKDLVENKIRIIEKAGFSPILIDVDSFALINAFEATQKDVNKEDVVALVNIGAQITNINVIKGGISYFTRDVSLAGNNITEYIVKNKNVAPEEAEKIKRDASAKIEDKNLKGLLDDLAGEIQLSFDYYENQAVEKGISKIYFSGGTVKLSGVDNYFAEGLGIPVEIWDPFKGVGWEDSSSLEQVRELGPFLSVGIGLALRMDDVYG
jgi:type IV pilus assembly protein PilM